MQEDEYNRNQPAYKAFALILAKRMQNKVEYKTQVIMSEVAK